MGSSETVFASSIGANAIEIPYLGCGISGSGLSALPKIPRSCSRERYTREDGPQRASLRLRLSHGFSALHDTLGRLHDTALHQRIAADLLEHGPGDARASRRVAFAMGMLTQAENAEVYSLTARLPKLAAHLAKAPRFWR